MASIEETTVVVEDFSSFDLDARLGKVLQKNNIIKPTLIQEKAIPLALEGKDILAKAKTGSGKTFAYLLPILQRLLDEEDTSTSQVKCLIFVPTKELARQVIDTLDTLCYYCPKSLTRINLASDESLQLQKSMLSASPSIIVSTPSRILPHLDGKNVTLNNLSFLVIDEADLVLSFGYAADVERLARDFIPKSVQTFLMSATLSPEIENLKKLVLRNPVTLKLEDGAEDDDDNNSTGKRLEQYIIRCEQDDKFLLMYVTLKLRLLKGRLIIFTNDVERCFKLKLFLEQFGIKACLLNAELPVASRHHIVEEFNRGVYDIIIASDIQYRPSFSSTTAGKDQQKGKNKRELQKYVKDQEGGVARGVDFKKVDVVINFDIPHHVDSYVHRIGRTARGVDSGTAISFISSTEDEAILKAIEVDQEARGQKVIPYDFDLKQLDGFKYRCNDAIRVVTKTAIKNARLQAIKNELTRSDKLKSFFEERPKDLHLLRHDRHLGTIQVKPQLKSIPSYLLANENEKRAKLDSLPQHESSNINKPVINKGSRSTFISSSKRNGRRNRDPLKKIKK